MEYALTPKALDELFVKHAERQYTRELLFSSVVDLMGMVVCKIEPSLCAAYQEVQETLPVSLTSVYNKLNGLETDVTAELVRHTARRLQPVIDAMGGRMPDLVPGYRVRILDGNHLAATERRLDVLRGSKAGPLPGHALVVLDPALMLVTDMIPCEDGHAQERSLTPQIVQLGVENDIWVADRNFCTAALLTGIAKARGFFAIRQHASLRIASAGTLRRYGRTDTGEVFEQGVTITDTEGQSHRVRRIVIRLDKPTRDGDTEMAIVTNLPQDVLAAVGVAELYRKRWTLETMFQSLTLMLEGEIAPLGYPRAALFGFGVALATYNILSTVQASLRAVFGADKVANDVSGYYIAKQVQKTSFGMSIAIEPSAWAPFQTCSAATLAKELTRVAKEVDLRKLKRHPRGEKKPVPKRTRFRDETHVSTARLLADSRKRTP